MEKKIVGNEKEMLLNKTGDTSLVESIPSVLSKDEIIKLQRELRKLVQERNDIVLSVIDDIDSYDESHFCEVYLKINKLSRKLSTLGEESIYVTNYVTYKEEDDIKSTSGLLEYVSKCEGSTEVEKITTALKEKKKDFMSTKQADSKRSVMVQLIFLFDMFGDAMHSESEGIVGNIINVDKHKDKDGRLIDNLKNDELITKQFELGMKAQEKERVGKELVDLSVSYAYDITKYDKCKFAEVSKRAIMADMDYKNLKGITGAFTFVEDYVPDYSVRVDLLSTINMAKGDTAEDLFKEVLAKLVDGYDTCSGVERLYYEKRFIMMMFIYSDILEAEEKGLPCFGINSKYYKDVDGTLLEYNDSNLRKSESINHLYYKSAVEKMEDEAVIKDASSVVNKTKILTGILMDVSRKEAINVRATKHRNAVKFINENYSEFEGSNSTHQLVKWLASLLKCHRGKDFRKELNNNTLTKEELKYLLNVSIDVDDIASEEAIEGVMWKMQ